MISDGKMDVQLDVSKASRVSRLEVIEGPTGRRTRSATVQPALAKLEIMVGDVVIRTEVEVDHLAGVILAMRASR